MPGPTTSPRLFSRGSFPRALAHRPVLRTETAGGVLLIIGAVVAIVWANTSWADSYEASATLRVGPASLHLDLTLGAWAADGLLAIFFFVVGLELKREFVAGTCATRAAQRCPSSRPSVAWPPPRWSSCCGTSAPTGRCRGWAIPTATDIAFAVAVLAVISTHLPSGLRTFLLTLAVVDDLLAITIIAIFYTDDLHLGFLALALIPIGAFGFLVQKRIRSGWLLIPLALFAWVLVHESGSPRNRCRRAARLHRPGPAQPGRRRTRSRTGTGRALRAPRPAHQRRHRRTGLRVLRRRRHRRRAQRPRRLAPRPRRPRHRLRPRDRQDRRNQRLSLAPAHGSPEQTSTTSSPGSTSSDCRCWPGSASPSPSSSANSPSATGQNATTTSRSESSSAR